jgi:D-alanyl-D-alanine carboxypeptidase
MNKRTWVALAIGSCLLAAGLTSPASAGTGPDRMAAIQTEVDGMVAAGVPGVVYLVRDGSLTRVLTAGVRDVQRGTPIRADDRFRIASITKSFVAVTILELVGEGQLSLDDTADRWVPGLLPDPTITVRQLLQHTSGLFDYAEDPTWWDTVSADLTRRWEPEQVIAVALSHPANFAPGTSYGYSNTGYAVLGLVAEAATGKSMASLVTSRVISPLRLADTYVSHNSTIRGHHAHGYTFAGVPGSDPSARSDVTRMNATLAVSSGDVISTVGDVARFYRALFEGNLLPTGLLSEMEHFVDPPEDDGSGYGYGLGLEKRVLDCGTTIFGHQGGIFGFSSDAAESADHRHQAVVFFNTDSLPTEEAYGDLYEHAGRAFHLSYCDD